MRVAARLPLPWIHCAGALLGRLVYRLSPTYARRLDENLRASGVARDAADYERLRRAAIREAGKAVLEIVKIWFAPVREVERLVECDTWAVVEEARAGGRGVILLTPHLGCFEACAFHIAQRIPLTALYRPPRIGWLEPLMIAGRSRGQARLAPANVKGVRVLYRALLKGEAIGVLPDQAPGAGEGVWATFFGRPAYTMTLAGRLQASSGARIVMTYAERLPRGGGYRLVFEALDAHPFDEETMNRAIEKQYLWSYNRYKTPAGARPRTDAVTEGPA
jgi:KDO2-lipid IV(A) lauroyltransferase